MKGQVAIEGMMSIGIILLLFLIIFAFTFERRVELIKTENYLNKRQECLKFSNLISSVYTAGDGTIMNASTTYVISVFKQGIISVEDKIGVKETRLAYYGCHTNEFEQGPSKMSKSASGHFSAPTMAQRSDTRSSDFV